MGSSTVNGGRTRIPRKILEFMDIRDGDTLVYSAADDGTCQIRKLTAKLLGAKR